jgi:hypothetical protein
MKKTMTPWKMGIDLPASLEFQNANGGIDPASQGYQYVIQTTTQIAADAIKQKFYEVPFGEYMPVDIGTGAWMEAIVKNLTYDSAAPFEQGIADLSTQAAITNVDAGVAPVSTKIYSWNRGYQYSLFETRKALAADNWDPIQAKYEALVKNWQLGIQQVAYLGVLLDPAGGPGLLSNPQVTANTAVITKYISSMSPDELSTFVSTVMAAYFANSNSTSHKPTHFAMPMQDWLGLDRPWSPSFPNTSIREYLTKAFREVTMNPDFTMYGVAYADQVNNAGVWATDGTNRYCLYRNDPEAGKLYTPVDMIINAPATSNNFQWQGVALGQFTGFQVYRDPLFLYFDWAV